MRTHIIGEDGNPVDVLAEKNEEIKQSLSSVLGEFIVEKETNRTLKVKEKLGYRFAKQIFLELSKYPRMKVDEFIDLSYEDIEDFWLKYLELTAYYNRYFEIVDNKQLFQAYMGINSRQYAELEEHEDEDVRSLMNSINSAFVGLGFVAGESGNADAKATTQRMRTKGEGHNLISASEDKMIETIEQKSPSDYIAQVDALLGGNVKKLIGG